MSRVVFYVHFKAEMPNPLTALFETECRSEFSWKLYVTQYIEPSCVLFRPRPFWAKAGENQLTPFTRLPLGNPEIRPWRFFTQHKLWFEDLHLFVVLLTPCSNMSISVYCSQNFCSTLYIYFGFQSNCGTTIF